MDGHLLRFQKDKNFTLIDLESFNLCLNFCHNVGWQVGVIVTKGDNILEEHDIIVKWDTKLKISADAARINHYSQEKVDRLGIAPEKAFELIYEKLKAADYIIMHNGLGFDLYLLKEWCLLMKKPWKFIRDKLIDTNFLAKGIHPKVNIPIKTGENLLQYMYRLQNFIVKGAKTRIPVLCEEYGIEFDEAKLHDAIYDLRKNFEIWQKLKWQVNI